MFLESEVWSHFSKAGIVMFTLGRGRDEGGERVSGSGRDGTGRERKRGKGKLTERLELWESFFVGFGHFDAEGGVW